jgi:hypothetical protein
VYQLGGGTGGSTYTFTPCCGESQVSPISVPAGNNSITICSSSYPIKTSGNGGVGVSLTACPSCDDASIFIRYRTSSGNGTGSFQSAQLRYSINGGPFVTLLTINSNYGTTYSLFNPTISANYGDVVSFFIVPVTGNNNVWGVGSGGSFSSIGCFNETYDFTVPITGNITISFNLTSQNSIWASVPAC